MNTIMLWKRTPRILLIRPKLPESCSSDPNSPKVAHQTQTPQMLLIRPKLPESCTSDPNSPKVAHQLQTPRKLLITPKLPESCSSDPNSPNLAHQTQTPRILLIRLKLPESCTSDPNSPKVAHQTKIPLNLQWPHPVQIIFCANSRFLNVWVNLQVKITITCKKVHKRRKSYMALLWPQDRFGYPRIDKSIGIDCQHITLSSCVLNEVASL
jgi:hypothetical protein